MSEQIFWHVVGNGRRAGVQGYILERTFKTVSAAIKYAKREGKPVWIVESRQGYLPVNEQRTCGGFEAIRWNSGAGLVGDTMPVLPLL